MPDEFRRWECPACGAPTPRGARHGLCEGRAVERVYVAVDAHGVALAERDELRAQVDRYRTALEDFDEELNRIPGLPVGEWAGHLNAIRCSLAGSLSDPVERERP